MLLIIFWAVIAIGYLVLGITHYYLSQSQFKGIENRQTVGSIMGVKTNIKETVNDINSFVDELNSYMRQTNQVQFYAHVVAFLVALSSFIVALVQYYS